MKLIIIHCKGFRTGHEGSDNAVGNYFLVLGKNDRRSYELAGDFDVAGTA